MIKLYETEAIEDKEEWMFLHATATGMISMMMMLSIETKLYTLITIIILMIYWNIWVKIYLNDKSHHITHEHEWSEVKWMTQMIIIISKETVTKSTVQYIIARKKKYVKIIVRTVR